MVLMKALQSHSSLSLREKKKKVLKSSQDDPRGQNENGRDGLWADCSGPFNCCPDDPREEKTKALITIMQTCHQKC